MFPRLPYQFCPMCGSDNFTPQSDNLLRCAQCDFHFHVNPVVAVAGILADATGRVLLIRRAKEPAKGKLAMPGGFVDLDETGEDALRREIKEEVNLDLRDVKYLASFPNRYLYRGITYPVLDLFFTARIDSWDEAKALAEVDSFVVCRPAEVKPGELAFESMVRAWNSFRSP